MSQDSFAMPHIYVGCPVEVSIGKSRGPYSLGLVMRPKHSGADVLVFGEGAVGMMFNCWHDDDPRVDTSPNDAWEDNTRGTWHLTEGEIRQRKMVADVTRLTQAGATAWQNAERADEINEMLDALALRIKSLEDAQQAGERRLPKRRGRPPKTVSALPPFRDDNLAAQLVKMKEALVGTV